MRKLNIVREADRRYPITFHPFRATAPVIDPEKPFPGTQRKAIDYFENYKAQSWWWLRRLFAYTYAVKLHWDKHKKLPDDFTADNLIVIRGSMAERTRLCMELSQPVWKLSKTGKMLVDKTPDEVPSPNLADAVMMVYAPKRMAVIVKDHHLNRGN